jgi:hypothetical protein
MSVRVRAGSVNPRTARTGLYKVKGSFISIAQISLTLALSLFPIAAYIVVE